MMGLPLIGKHMAARRERIDAFIHYGTPPTNEPLASEELLPRNKTRQLADLEPRLKEARSDGKILSPVSSQ